MSILDRIIRFFFPRQFEAREEYPEAEDDIREEEDSDDKFDDEGTLYFRKIVKSVFYCTAYSGHRGDRKMVYAITFEDNNADRSDELVNEIEIHPDFKSCFQTGEYGYDDQATTINPHFEYPTIQVGEE